MNTYFIKWMCDKAEGFDFSINHRMHEFVWCPDSEKLWIDDVIDHSGWEDVYYPLLLQRAIEGVNRECLNEEEKRLPFIDIYSDIIDVRGIEDERCYSIVNHPNIDQAKESALMYIYEQEKEG